MPVGRHLADGPPAIWRPAGPLLALAWFVGWLIGDPAGPWLWFFFIPAPFTVFVCGCWLLTTRRRAHTTVRIGTAALMVLAAWKMLHDDFAWHRAQAASGDSIRVVHWNTARRFRKAPHIFATTSRDRPDLCVFSEPPSVPDRMRMGMETLGLRHVLERDGMLLFSRWPASLLDRQVLPAAHAWRARIETPRGPLDLLAFDMVSHPTVDRRPALDGLARMAASRDPTVPLILVGDFNTPRDADSLLPLRGMLRNAYEVSGRGWPYTWPVPMPVYAIDQMWVSPEIRVERYTLQTSWLSDHRRQVMDVTWPAP